MTRKGWHAYTVRWYKVKPRLVVPGALGDTACRWLVVALAANEVCHGVPALYDRTDTDCMPDGPKYWGSIADSR